MSFLAERKKNGLSQAAVADELGVTAAAVCQWETGKTKPASNKLLEIAALYGCTVDELLSDDSTVAPAT